MSMLPVRLLLASVAIGCAAGITWSVFGSVSLLSGAAVSGMSVPEDGAVTTGRYINKYFDLSFVVPEGLTAGLAGPEPSEAGYYALTSLVPVDESGGGGETAQAHGEACQELGRASRQIEAHEMTADLGNKR